MKLSDYLYDNSMTPTQLRRMLDVTCRSTIWRYLIGERVPQPAIMDRIEKLTGGLVRLADFLDPAPPRCARVVIGANGKERWLLPWSSVKAKDELPFESRTSRLSQPVKQGMLVLRGRAWYTPNGRFLLDGRISDLKRIMRAANDELQRRGEPRIPYPGVFPLENG